MHKAKPTTTCPLCFVCIPGMSVSLVFTVWAQGPFLKIFFCFLIFTVLCFCHTTAWISHSYAPIPSDWAHSPRPSRLPWSSQGPRPGSLCCPAAFHQLSILHVCAYMLMQGPLILPSSSLFLGPFCKTFSLLSTVTFDSLLCFLIGPSSNSLKMSGFFFFSQSYVGRARYLVTTAPPRQSWCSTHVRTCMYWMTWGTPVSECASVLVICFQDISTLTSRCYLQT